MISAANEIRESRQLGYTPITEGEGEEDREKELNKKKFQLSLQKLPAIGGWRLAQSKRVAAKRGLMERVQKKRER